MNNWLMIVNPSSASSTNDRWKACEKVLSDGGIPVDKAFTQHAGHAIDLAREGAEKGYRRFIAVGGDGTLVGVTTSLLDSLGEAVNAQDVDGLLDVTLSLDEGLLALHHRGVGDLTELLDESGGNLSHKNSSFRKGFPNLE